VAPVIGYCILHDYHAWTLGLFAYAGISDLLDGWIARKWNVGTVVGTVIDPMADKTLMTVLTVTLAMKGALPGENREPFVSYREGVAHACRQTRLTHWDKSLAGGDHPGTGRGPRHCSHLLQVDLVTAAQDLHAVLGFFAAVR